MARGSTTRSAGKPSAAPRHRQARGGLMASSNETGSGHQQAEYGDQQVERGLGGETHQVAAGNASRLTTQQGIVISDDQNTLRSGERGPAALEDFHFREKIFHFDHERIPERVVHA